MSNNGQVTNEQAAEQLTAAWNQTHVQDVDAWNQQVQADLAEQEELTRLAEEEESRRQANIECEKEEERKEQEKKRPKINDFDESKMVADHVMPCPSQFAIGKFKSFSFVELWYFTDEGCAEAQISSRAQSNDAYGLTKVDNLVALKPVTLFKASHNVIPDANLTWRQMNVGKNTMLCFMDLCDWPQKHVQSLAHFYFNIELDPMRSRPNGERMLIAYQAKVRRQWHDDLSRGSGFNIAPINQKLLSTVTEEVWDTIKSDAIKKVSFPSPKFLDMLLTGLCPLLFHLLALHARCPPLLPCHAIMPILATLPMVLVWPCHTRYGIQPCHAMTNAMPRHPKLLGHHTM